MNAKAAQLGMRLHALLLPAGYLRQGQLLLRRRPGRARPRRSCAQPRLARIVARRQAVLPFPIKGGKLYLYNNNPLLSTNYPARRA